LIAWVLWEGLVVYLQFERRHWDEPARVYAAPMELYVGRDMSPARLGRALTMLGYREASGDRVDGPAWWRKGGTLRVRTRPFEFWDGAQVARVVQIDFDDSGISRLRDAGGAGLPVLRLDPLEIGSIFPAHGEDRLALRPEDIPPRLRQALVAVEDRKFASHHGIDARAILRALWVNLRAGAVRQGGSTLTQQLVKNYFLDSRRTIGRKLREAVMSIWLEALYEKDEIFTAYVNEIYLGQDGRRAVHGFGLGSRFYFGRPLSELELYELALLVAVVRGPTYYDPWRHPGRALERRNRVIDAMSAEGLIPDREAGRARAQPLGIKPAGFRAGYHPAFLDLVRRQLRTDYRDEDLTTRGLRVFTTLEPEAQRTVEEVFSEGIGQLTGATAAVSELQGAAIVARVQTGDVTALVGGRDTGFDGFNRALEATRPIGSLVKPAVYLAAIETGGRHLASLISDEPVEVTLPEGGAWEPRNFSGESHGEVTLVRALAESFNLATVRLGLEVGVERVADVLRRLGAVRDLQPLPSLLLGAVEMTPYELAGLYATLASGGFRSRLRAVREVIGPDGEPLSRYPIEVDQAFAAGHVYELNSGLALVMSRGTGRTADGRRPPDIATAGKTGTSDDFRDSWFAGFDGDNLAVVWLGNDDNTPIGLSGARGALPVWADIMAGLGGGGIRTPPPAGVVDVWVDYTTGEMVTSECGDGVLLGLPEDTRLPVKSGCGPWRRSINEVVKDWLKRLGN
jgi:penicillin-binding protein 1B